MKRIFEEGHFSEYTQFNLSEARGQIIRPNLYYSYASSHAEMRKTTVFISHKHDDLKDLQGLLGFLEKRYKVKVYIDSRDSSMPDITSDETAQRIKQRIKECDKFILLATNAAIESKWCNWELGFGDADKFDKNIALFPMKKKNSSDSSYKGHEYMSIYPCIEEDEGIYYVRKKDGTLVLLETWLK